MSEGGNAPKGSTKWDLKSGIQSAGGVQPKEHLGLDKDDGVPLSDMRRQEVAKGRSELKSRTEEYVANNQKEEQGETTKKGMWAPGSTARHLGRLGMALERAHVRSTR